MPVTFLAPTQLRPGQHFAIRIGSTQRPGGSSLGNAIIHVKDAPEAFLMGAQIFPSPRGQGPQDAWSIDLRGQVNPNFAGEGKVYEVEVALLDAQGRIGAVKTWQPQILGAQPLVCPEAATCGAAQCGFESTCGLNCGPLAGACVAGEVCTFDQQCVEVGPACPAAADCQGRTCGVDPVCGAINCGTCAAGQSCTQAGACWDDPNSTSETTSDSTSSDTSTSDTSSDTSTDSVLCEAGQIRCNGQCVDPSQDPRYCGATLDCNGLNSGTLCQQSETCEAGVCVAVCGVGTVVCEDGCIDPQTSTSHCGAADPCDLNPGNACKPEEVCSLGACTTTCAAWQVRCGDACIDPQNDPKHCGVQEDCVGGDVCKVGEVCGGGMCKTTCSPDEVTCEGRCEDPKVSLTHCGAKLDCLGANSGKACKVGEVCNQGQCESTCTAPEILCGGRCIDPARDLTYCGATGSCTGLDNGSVCKGGERCSAGSCINFCDDKAEVECFTEDFVSCIDPQTEPKHCGAKLDCEGKNAGDRCEFYEDCIAGKCEAKCADSQALCQGQCIDPMTDSAFCGASGNTCEGANWCSLGRSCVAGACQCASNLVDCGGQCIDPLTDTTYCGASLDCQADNAGKTCGPNEECMQGGCIDTDN